MDAFEPDEGLLPEEEFSRGALDAAERFFLAVATGDTAGLWRCLSDGARAYALNIAIERGMDFDLASRIRQGSASREEMEDYLEQLLEGLRRDLRGVDLHRLAFESTAVPEAPLQVRVTYLVSLPGGADEAQAAIPAGSVIMTYEDDTWKLERIIPRPGR